MNVRSFLTELEIILEEQIKDNYPHSWDENHITYCILNQIGKKLNNVKIEGLKQRMKIEWKLFKLRGKNERKFGDVALLVNISHQDGDRLEGVAFLEAKKRSQNKTKFDAMKITQFRRICSNAPNSMSLLYDYEDTPQFANIETPISRRDWLVWKPCTCCVVVPLRIIQIIKKTDTSLYKFSLPFSYQLLYRYFNGFDLEFKPSLLKTAKGYAIKNGFPTYLVFVSVAFGKAEPYREVDVNRDLFESSHFA